MKPNNHSNVARDIPFKLYYNYGNTTYYKIGYIEYTLTLELQKVRMTLKS